jgi:hypothetical protein
VTLKDEKLDKQATMKAIIFGEEYKGPKLTEEDTGREKEEYSSMLSESFHSENLQKSPVKVTKTGLAIRIESLRKSGP